jgi:hypothetical protein
MNLPRFSRKGIVGLLLLVVIVGWFAGRRFLNDAPLAPRSEVLSVPSKVEGPRPDAESSASAVAPASGGVSACQEQQLDVVMGGKSRRHCVGRTQVVRNGSVRTYRVEAHGANGASLKVDAGGGVILSAELGSADEAAFTCREGRCAGISMGPHDQQGARSILLDQVRLLRHKPDGAEDLAIVSGKLRTVPDDELASSTCVGQVLLISIGDGTVHFCPDAGTGFDLDDDGGKTYRFTNIDGGSLGVQLDKDDVLRKVEYERFACNGAACVGARVSPAEPDGSRNFVFQGTTLVERDTGSAAAILNGNVVLAPQ